MLHKRDTKREGEKINIYIYKIYILHIYIDFLLAKQSLTLVS